MLVLPKTQRPKDINAMIVVDRGEKKNRKSILDPTLPFTFEGIMNKL